MLRRIAIRPSDGDVKPGGPLGAFWEEQAMSRHRGSPSPFLSSSSHTTQLRYTYSHPNLNLQYTLQVLIPHVMWSAQAVRELKIDHTQHQLSALHGPKARKCSGLALEHTHTHTHFVMTVLTPVRLQCCLALYSPDPFNYTDEKELSWHTVPFISR